MRAPDLAHLITTAEAHYDARGFVKWTDLATELGTSRQRILQMMQKAVCLGLITGTDLDRYRSESSRRAASRNNKQLARDREALTIRVTLTPENRAWLRHQVQDHPGTTSSDVINTVLTQTRNASHA